MVLPRLLSKFFFSLKIQTFLVVIIRKKLQKLKVGKNNEDAFKKISEFYTSTISSCSKESPNSSNPISSLHPSQLTSPYQLKGDLQSILESLSQIFITNINLKKIIQS